VVVDFSRLGACRYVIVMPGKLFISQAAIDAWVSSDRVDLQGEVLTLRGGAGALRLRAASYFRKVAGDGDDRRGLIGRVKDEDALAALGAEAYMTSVLFDDTAYDVEPGFLATPLGELNDGGVAVLAALRAVAGTASA
jgi:hypothetical protein